MELEEFTHLTLAVVEEQKDEKSTSLTLIQHKYINELVAENQRLEQNVTAQQEHIVYLQRQLK